MKKSIACAVVCIMLSVGLIACSGGGGGGSDCAAPAINASGTWCITITNTSNTCGNPPDSTPYPAVYTLNGSAISATAFMATYTGTMCGNTANMTGTNNGFDISISTTFTDTSHASGTSTYTSASCHGVDTFSAVSGPCQ